MITQTNPPAILHLLADIKSFLGFWLPLWHLCRLFLIPALWPPMPETFLNRRPARWGRKALRWCGDTGTLISTQLSETVDTIQQSHCPPLTGSPGRCYNVPNNAKHTGRRRKAYFWLLAGRHRRNRSLGQGFCYLNNHHFIKIKIFTV